MTNSNSPTTRNRPFQLILPGNDSLLFNSTFLFFIKIKRQLYHFDKFGKHLETIDPLTQTKNFTFGYDQSGKLVTVTDRDGKVTTIQRTQDGSPNAITAPGNQITTLALNADGYLSAVTNPNNETERFTYGTDGLMTTYADTPSPPDECEACVQSFRAEPKGNTHTFDYDLAGYLLKDTDPMGGYTALARTDTDTAFDVTSTSALGRRTSYHYAKGTDNSVNRSTTDTAGLVTTTVQNPDGSSTLISPDGTRVTSTSKPDPRFGAGVQYDGSSTTTLPSGLTMLTTHDRMMTVTGVGADSILASLTDTLTVNGKITTSTYTVADRKTVGTSPMGKISALTIDEKGRPILSQFANLASATMSYDQRGNLASTSVGSGSEVRTTTFAYDDKDRPLTVTDPIGRVAGFEYDPVGRVTRKLLPDGRVIGYQYDENGNVTSITPPSKPAYLFDYDLNNIVSVYAPPDIGIPQTNTTYEYNLDKQPTLITK